MSKFAQVWGEAVSATDGKDISPTWARPSQGRTALAVIHGSHCYGTATPTSDYDIRGVISPPKEHLLGFAGKFDQLIVSAPHDLALYDIRKFFQLAAQCNPNILEILFVPDHCVVEESLVGTTLRQHRHRFLSKRVRHTFSGYAHSQLKRIESHRRWLLNPPTGKPNRADFGLQEGKGLNKASYDVLKAMVQKKVDSWMLNLDGLGEADRIDILNRIAEVVEEQIEGLQVAADRKEAVWVAAQTVELQHLTSDTLKAFDAERRYKDALNNWNNYEKWKTDRNASRAELERKFGYDTKHAMHLVRLLRMCKETLSDADMYVFRPDAEELLEIRNGGWGYDNLMSWAEAQEAEIAQAEASSRLPKSPDLKNLDALCAVLVEQGMS